MLLKSMCSKTQIQKRLKPSQSLFDFALFGFSFFDFALLLMVSLSFSSLLTADASAAVPQSVADQLLTELTPLGAVKRGTEDGSIPQWRNDPQENADNLKRLMEELPLFVIGHGNYDQYLEWLSPGTVALFTRYPESFSIPVYPTYRTAKLPEWLYQNAIRNAVEAQINEDGTNVDFARPGIPFPIPQSGEEAIWNHILRWKGLFFKLETIDAVVDQNGKYNIIDNTLEVYSIYHDQQVQRNQDDWKYVYYLSYINAPASLAGGAYLSYESLKPMARPRQSWMYMSGQRRMRRSPVMGYDAPTFTSDGLRMMDEIDVFNGALDRYDWQLVGRKEMFVPYNNDRLQKTISDDEKVLTVHHIAPEFTRYEKHRVWVIEANLKEGSEHVYKRRTFYLDEDTWSILMVDIYNEEDQLWRVTKRYASYYEDVPVMLTALDAFYDLQKKSYYIQAFPDGYNHSYEAPKSGYFSPNIVRQRLHR